MWFYEFTPNQTALINPRFVVKDFRPLLTRKRHDSLLGEFGFPFDKLF
jgi:hypothetical protein